MLKFEYTEDCKFFEHLLCEAGQTLEQFSDLFDFRPPKEKRNEYTRIRQTRMDELIKLLGNHCMLRYATDCDSSGGLVLDHLIPLSSNKLNKQLRGIGTLRTGDGKLKKALTQSFGSNGHRNLILACHNCNSLKQNGFLSAEMMRPLIKAISYEIED